MKWDLDFWYELWDRAGSRGLDTWHDLRGDGRDVQAHGLTSDATGSEPLEGDPSEGT
jgi:hypothetical protein